MRIEVAGAGAGKTSNMASNLLSVDLPDNKVIFCIAFTNAAVRRINSKLIERNGCVPPRIKVSTIHSFLYREIIQPYYHLLFGKRYESISTIELPVEYKKKNKRISELDCCGLLHQTKIPERAKWVFDKKSNDNKQTRAKRNKIIAMFQSYCYRIVVDEAQDIDKDTMNVLLALHRAGVPIELYGDPKQDVRGRKCFRQLISNYPKFVVYRNDCHRCPACHLRLSNRLAPAEEKQEADDNTCIGSVRWFFESGINGDIEKFIKDEDFGLVYISKKNKRFNTHGYEEKDKWLDSLRYELEAVIRENQKDQFSDLEIKRKAYCIATELISSVNNDQNVEDLMKNCEKKTSLYFSKRRHTRISDLLKRVFNSFSNGVRVRSIDAIKGLEHERCLFVLTTDLAPYLIENKNEDNKSRHLLYVALTRSLDDLSILITKEVENRYQSNEIVKAINPNA